MAGKVYSLFPSLSEELIFNGKADESDPETQILDRETLDSLHWNELQRINSMFKDRPRGPGTDAEAIKDFLEGKQIPHITINDKDSDE